MSRKRIKNNFLNHPTLNKCIEAIEIQVILIKKVLSIDFIDEATWHVINGPNYTQSTDGAVYVPDIGIKISLKVFGNPICVYIGTCILCHKNFSTYFSLRITSRDRWWWILENHLLLYKFLSPVSNSGVSGTVCNRGHSLGWTARFLHNNTSRWQLHDKKSRWCKKKCEVKLWMYKSYFLCKLYNYDLTWVGHFT